jgi:hypothetical protein
VTDKLLPPARSSLGLVPSLIGTARSGLSSGAMAKEGPVRRVGSDPWRALRVSHGDPILRFRFLGFDLLIQTLETSLPTSEKQIRNPIVSVNQRPE